MYIYIYSIGGRISWFKLHIKDSRAQKIIFRGLKVRFGIKQTRDAVDSRRWSIPKAKKVKKDKNFKQVRLTMVPHSASKPWTKINIKTSTVWKKMAKTAQNSIMSPHAMYFWHKKGQNGQKSDFPGPFTCFIKSKPEKIQFTYAKLRRS